MEARYNKDNWVLNENGEPRQVEGYNHSSLWLRVKGCEKVSFSISKNKVKPILLTEDILLKCGFTKVLNQYKKITSINKGNFDNIPFIILYLENEFQYDDLRFRTNIKHLHQLQNLYFALTSEELNIQL